MTLATLEIGLEAGKIGIEKSIRMLLQKCKGEIIRAALKAMGIRWKRLLRLQKEVLVTKYVEVNKIRTILKILVRDDR